MFTILGADGNEYGPVTAGKILEWIQGGRANLQTKARRSGETDWKLLGEFQEFAIMASVPAGPAEIPVIPTHSVIPPLPLTVAARATNLERELASRWVRLGAVLLDGLIGGAFMLPGLAVLLAGGFFSNPDHPNPPLLIAGGTLLCLTVLVLLGIQIYLLTTRGQTMGKRLMGIRIVDYADESNPGFVKAFLLRAFVNGLIGAVPIIGAAYSLVDICFIFRDDQRCLHDLLAGTKVVKS